MFGKLGKLQWNFRARHNPFINCCQIVIQFVVQIFTHLFKILFLLLALFYLQILFLSYCLLNYFIYFYIFLFRFSYFIQIFFTYDLFFSFFSFPKCWSFIEVVILIVSCPMNFYAVICNLFLLSRSLFIKLVLLDNFRPLRWSFGFNLMSIIRPSLRFS